LFKPVRHIIIQKKGEKFEDEDDEMIIEKSEDDRGFESVPSSPAEVPSDTMYINRKYSDDLQQDAGDSDMLKGSPYTSPENQNRNAKRSSALPKLNVVKEESDSSGDDGEHLSQVSENYREDRDMSDTASERAVKLRLSSQLAAKSKQKNDSKAFINDDRVEKDGDDLSIAESDRDVGRNSISQTVASAASSASYFYQNMVDGLSNAKLTLMEKAELVKQRVISYTDAKGNYHASTSQVEIRDYYPKMGWHDLQVSFA